MIFIFWLAQEIFQGKHLLLYLSTGNTDTECTAKYWFRTLPWGTPASIQTRRRSGRHITEVSVNDSRVGWHTYDFMKKKCSVCYQYARISCTRQMKTKMDNFPHHLNNVGQIFSKNWIKIIPWKHSSFKMCSSRNLILRTRRNGKCEKGERCDALTPLLHLQVQIF